MSDIPLPSLNTLVNIQPVTVSPASQQPNQQPTVLSSLPNGTLVTGFVIQRDSHNQPIMRTEFGDVLVNTSLFLKTGTELALRVDNTQPNHARIISINGQTPETFAKLQAAQAMPPSEDIIATSVSATLANTVPKPVQLAGMLLQLQPDKALPLPLLESALKAMGVNRAPAMDSLPVDIIVRSLIQRSQPASTSPASPARPQAQPAAPQLAQNSQPQPNIAQPSALAIQGVTSMGGQALPPSPAATSMPQHPTIATQSTAAFLPPSMPMPSENTAAAPSPRTATPQAMVQQQNLISSQSLPPDMAEQPTSQMEMAPKPDIALTQYKADLSNLSRSVNNTPAPPSYPSGIEPRIPGEPHPAFRGLLASQPITVTAQNTVRMDAQVIGQESGGDTILHTPLGIMKAFTAKPMPPGATASIEIKPAASTPQQPGTLPVVLPEDMQEIAHLARDWPALSSLLANLQRADPNTYQELLQHTIPTTGKPLTHGMLFFLAALKGGEMRSWIGGKALDVMELRQPELLRRAAMEFSGLQQASVESSNQGWMTTVIPIMHEQMLHQARLFIRQENEEEKSAPNKGQRFIIEVDLSQLGEMQLDGFVMKDGTRHQFDIIIRSIRPLPLEMQQDIRTLYDNAAQAAGFKGMLTFQSNRDQFVRPLSTMRKDSGSGILA